MFWLNTEKNRKLKQSHALLITFSSKDVQRKHRDTYVFYILNNDLFQSKEVLVNQNVIYYSFFIDAYIFLTIS